MMTLASPSIAGDLWVFGYGSLMWRPGFEFLEMHRARLYGYHRAFCVYSWVHRGTKERPGLVLGLDRGGSCIGRLFRVAAREADAVVRYLDEREMVTGVYVPVEGRVRFEGRDVRARTYIADRGHAQYAGKLPVEAQARLVAGAVGQSGVNRDYVLNTVAHLETMGIADGPLHRLAALLAG
jgi:cation transport protein ChaC